MKMYLALKRASDLVLGTVALIILSPILVVISAIVMFSSPGGVLFRHRRVGMNGRMINVFKFRTMVANAANMGSSVTRFGDPRITSLGQWLRRSKLDELPQIFNVLNGTMSFVGPRPDVQEIVDTYDLAMRQILSVPPGITSVASLQLQREEELLAGSCNPDDDYIKIIVPKKVMVAMEHVDRKSIVFDLSVLAQTFLSVCFGISFKGANGMVLVDELRQQVLKASTYSKPNEK